jgi:Eukaryotic translation initiation factor 3 subunit 7 (eIF-3)
MEEAVRVNNAFLYQQYYKGDDKKHALGEKDPFIEVEDQVAVRQGYLYKIWRLDNKKRICIRSTVGAYKSKTIPEEEGAAPRLVYQNAYTMMEYENSKLKWKGNLDA